MKRVLMFAATLLAGAPLALAQQVQPTGPQPQTGQAGETSDRTPEKATPTPQAQKDTADGHTSDRSHDRNATVKHQPGAAGTGGSADGASDGQSGTDAPAGR